MQQFNKIDKILEKFAKRMGATFTRNNGGQSINNVPVPPEKYISRQLYWNNHDDTLKLAIVINQDFRNMDQDNSAWEFRNHALPVTKDTGTSGSTNFISFTLAKKVRIDYIETHIDELLQQSFDNLTPLTVDDLPLQKKNKARREKRIARKNLISNRSEIQ